MIYSMTAFTKQEIKNTNFTATWEIRSTNHRYLKIYIYLPNDLRELETNIRTQIAQTNNIHRGQIECTLYININFHHLKNSILVNKQLIKNLIKSTKHIPLKINYIDPLKILAWPGVVIQKTINNYNKIYPILLQSFENTLSQLIKMRKNEGIALEKIITIRLSKINNEIAKIKKEIPIETVNKRNKLLKKIKEINLNIDNNRLEEELFIHAQRSDISEEIDRINIHIKNVNFILSQEIPVGRKLDFIMQELHKETNTMSAKTTNINIIQSSIEIKVLIDQIREQIQNVE